MINLSFRDSEKIIECLNQGQQLNKVLCANNESIYFKLIESLSSYMSLSKSIVCANKIDQSLSALLKKVLKRITYPLFIFCFAYFMILFFSNSIVPQMSTFSTQENSYLILDILKISFTLLFIVLCSLVLTFTFCLISKRFRIFCIYRLEVLKIYKIYQSIQFSIVFEVLLESGLSTKICFEALNKMNFYTIVYHLSEQINNRLNQGEKLELVIDSISFDPTFIKFFKMGIKTGSLDKILQLYQKQAKSAFEKYINRIISGIQIISYVSVGMLVLVVYQIMLVPLNMLNTM